jgi:hypothetical protein
MVFYDAYMLAKFRIMDNGHHAQQEPDEEGEPEPYRSGATNEIRNIRTSIITHHEVVKYKFNQ